jgi:hypothetical protein
VHAGEEGCEGEESSDKYYACLLTRLQTSMARINSLQGVLQSASPVVDGTMTVGEMGFLAEEKESDVKTLLDHGRAFVNDLNVRISIDEETLRKAEQRASSRSGSGSEVEGTKEGTGAAGVGGEVSFSIETEEERIKESLGTPIRTNIMQSVNTVMKGSLGGGDVDDVVRAQVAQAVENALDRQEDVVKVHMDKVREYLKGRGEVKIEVGDDVRVSVQDHNEEDEVRRKQLEEERVLDDHIAGVVENAGMVDETVKCEVDAVIKDVLQSSHDKASDGDIVRSERDIASAFSEGGRYQQLLEEEEVKRAASYARGNVVDVAALMGDLNLEEDEISSKPLQDRKEVSGSGSPKNDLSKYKDYAVGPRGGRVFVQPAHFATHFDSSDTSSVLTSPPYKASDINAVDSVLYHSGLDRTSADPQSVLSHVIPPAPGHCYAFAGSSGNITVMLHSSVDVFGVGVYHIPLTVATDHMKGSAPRMFAVYGWINKPVVQGVVPGLKRVVTGEAYYLGDMIYREAKDASTALQTFNIARTLRGPKGITVMPSFSAVTFAIADNYGNDHYTCVYRLQVMGELSRNY